jgi:hypothetical protein
MVLEGVSLAVRQTSCFQHDSFSTLLGRCLAVAECNISRKFDWISRADFMASSVASSDSDGTWRNMFIQYLPGLENLVTRLQAAMTTADVSMLRHVQ